MLFEIYVLGGYLALLFYTIMLEFDTIREYFTLVIKEFLKFANMKNVHPYSIMQTLSMVCVIFSWISFIGLIILLVDYFKYKNKE